jgi:cellulose synthase/poly-beta-1,6-N-acetylglucosamine synthase-like glycosyltransferase
VIKFSIVIPIRTLNDFLRENIFHLEQLEYKNFEVILISDEETELSTTDDRFKLFFVGNKGPGEKRNLGVEKSSGDVVVFLDDDAFPSKTWLTEAAKIFEDKQVYALGAPAMTPPKAPFLERMSGRIHESFLASYKFKYRHIPSKKQLIDDYPTVNLFVRKEAFESVGGFITEFWPGEDTKLCLDLVNKFGRKFLYHPKPVVYHHRRDVFLPHLKQVSRYGQHRGQFARIFPQTSAIPSYFVPSAFVLGLLLGPIVCYFVPILWWFYGSVVAIYSFLILWESIKVLLKEKSLLAGIYMFFGVLMTHIVYGVNIMVGLINKPKLKLRSFDEETGNYLGG